MDVLAGLDPEQREVALALDGPVMVIAGAGTGKTRAITHRIANAVLSGAREARSGLAVTFTTRAAGEMRERLARLGAGNLAARTFHAAALSQLRYFWPQAVGGPFPELLASKAKLVAVAAAECGLPTNRTMVRDLSGEVEWAGSSLVLPATYAATAAEAGRVAPANGASTLTHADVARVLSSYLDLKARRNVIDFEDVLLNLIAIMGNRPQVADEIRAAYRWFTVDEYQDVTPLQVAMLESWLGDRNDVCVVGDPAQTIYSFAGAAPDSLKEFGRKYGPVTEIRLDRCYRCSPQIVACANSLNSRREMESQAAPVLLRSQVSPGPRPELVTCADEPDEAETIAKRLGALLLSGIDPREVAVLLRTNAASEPLEAALASAGIPYTMRGAERFFARPEVREAVVRLRGAAHSQDRQAAATEGGLAASTAAVLSSMDWSPTGPAGGSANRERWESLAALVALAEDLAAQGVQSLAQLVAELERRAEVAHAPTAAGVTLATLHAAKGLEWDHVFIAGLVEGGLPIVHANTSERVAEERRLFYVGITRARRSLTLTWALSRSAGGRPRARSRFLGELRGATGDNAEPGVQSGVIRRGAGSAGRRRGRSGPAKCRVCGAGLVTGPEHTRGRCRKCPGSPDEQLLDHLRKWRQTTAAAREVPAFVVFTDVTMAAIAERRPADLDALLAIPGIGPAKAELYGEAILGLVRAGSLD
ncbi:MAG: ATP-dependent DNA helicase UvrD2 [Candidatus Nanopelagicales bacterium]